MEGQALGDLDRLRRVAVAGVVLAVIVSIPANVAFFAAFGWNIEAAVFGTPGAILPGGASSAALLRWGAFGDALYSYLLLVPLALFLHRRLRPNGAWLADLGAVAGLAYIFVGGAGAVILAIAGSSLVDAYAKAPLTEQPAIALLFDVLRRIVFLALWQLIDAITLGTWILSTGLLLLHERFATSRLLVVLGLGLLSASVMTLTGTSSLAVLVAGLIVALLAWAGWVFFDRGRAPREISRPT
jgi:hypothetical protein